MRATRNRRRWTAAAVAGVSVAATLMSATNAEALGNNRVVNRSCGSNYVASGYSSGGGYYWVETSKNSGDCAGRLSTGFQRSDGFRTVRNYGTSSIAFDTVTRGQLGGSVQYGLHWGCDNCNVTYS